MHIYLHYRNVGFLHFISYSLVNVTASLFKTWLFVLLGANAIGAGIFLPP